MWRVVLALLFWGWLLWALVGGRPLQWLAHQLPLKSAGVRLGVAWAEATLLAGGPGVFGSAVFSELILTARPGWGSLVWGGLVGAFFALLQWRVVAHAHWAGRWFWATGAGWALACGVCVNLFLRLGNGAFWLMPVVGALCVGVPQAWALRGQAGGKNVAGWNALALGVSLAAGLGVGVVRFTGRPLLPWEATLVFGLVCGVTTGAALWPIFKHG